MKKLFRGRLKEKRVKMLRIGEKKTDYSNYLVFIYNRRCEGFWIVIGMDEIQALAFPFA